MLQSFAVLVTALLFGGMVLYSFGFAAFVFTALPAEIAGATIRRAFPHFYAFVLATSLVAALLLWPIDTTSAVLMAVVAITTVPTRQLLMPAINKATNSGHKTQFKWLHTLSVMVTLAHIAMSATVLVRLT